MRIISNTEENRIIILNDIRSTYNVGAIFRTADAVGILKIYLVGTTPTPVDRFGRSRGDIAKTALGAEKTIPWEYVKNIGPLLKKLKKTGFYIVAVEQSEDSIDYKKISARGGSTFGGKLLKKSAIILGNEVDGISPKVLKECDVVAEISMKGEKESLNVSVAAGVVLFRIFNI